MRALLTAFPICPLLLLLSCQVPASLSRSPGPATETGGDGEEAPSPFLSGIAGLEAPTWDQPFEPGEAPGPDRPLKDTYTRVSTPEKVIAMTFDDGPHGANTPRLLDMLKKRKIKATFYVVGNMVKYNPQLLRRMIAEGHEIGNHTVSHGNLSRMSDDRLRSELRRAHNQILEATGVPCRTMRPPGGAIRSDQKKLMLEEFGYPTILWSVDPEDWKRPGVSVVTQRLVSRAHPGGILLAHDLHKPTVDAMPSTLDQLLAKGYRFVTVTELLAMDQAPVEEAGEEEEGSEGDENTSAEEEGDSEEGAPPGEKEKEKDKEKETVGNHVDPGSDGAASGHSMAESALVNPFGVRSVLDRKPRVPLRCTRGYPWGTPSGFAGGADLECGGMTPLSRGRHVARPGRPAESSRSSPTHPPGDVSPLPQSADMSAHSKAPAIMLGRWRTIHRARQWGTYLSAVFLSKSSQLI